MTARLFLLVVGVVIIRDTFYPLPWGFPRSSSWSGWSA